ncbi:MAG: hypothetical protein [Bacteriophage sp.]|nr:MAG: hypothetical protein [Bacteriophage sp.]
MKPFCKTPPQDILNDLLYLDGKELRWRKAQGNRTAGSIAGTIRPDGYKRIKVCGSLLLVHRVVWAMHFGDTDLYIDHLNGDRADNRIDNLRLASREQNKANEKIRTNNSSGFIGVSWYKPTDKRKKHCWVVKVASQKRYIHVGYFDNLREAVEAYNEHCLKHQGEFARRKIEHNLKMLALLTTE